MKQEFLKYAELIYEQIDAVYVTDKQANTYLALKTGDIFSEIFGESGSYEEMLKRILVHSSNKMFAQSEVYSDFLDNTVDFQGKTMQTLRLSVEDRSVLSGVACYPLNDHRFVLLFNRLEEGMQLEEKEAETDKTIRSAYLFSMRVDLDTGMCSNVSIPEVDPVELSSRNIDPSYQAWRNTSINTVHPNDREAFLLYTSEEFLRANLTPHHPKSLNCQMINLEGSMIWVKLSFNLIESEDDFCFVFMIEDINDSHAELMDELSKYESMARRDSLTGLLNHGSIETIVADAKKQAEAEGVALSLMMFDLDHFKRINDTYGHAVGDKVLKKTAEIAKALLEKYEIPVGRWGGEEFIAVCKGSTGNAAGVLAEQLRQAIAACQFDEGFLITSSFGVYEVPAEVSPELAFEKVDAALYRAKNEGRNRVVTV